MQARHLPPLVALAIVSAFVSSAAATSAWAADELHEMAQTPSHTQKRSLDLSLRRDDLGTVWGGTADAPGGWQGLPDFNRLPEQSGGLGRQSAQQHAPSRPQDLPYGAGYEARGHGGQAQRSGGMGRGHGR